MALRTEVDRRLAEWGHWRRAQEARLGGRPCSDVCSAWGATATADMEKTDRSVASLPPSLRLTVIEVYVRAGSRAEQASRLGCPEATLVRRLGRAHLLLSEQSDVEAEAVLRHRQSAAISAWLASRA